MAGSEGGAGVREKGKGKREKGKGKREKGKGKREKGISVTIIFGETWCLCALVAPKRRVR
jgi:hypothetical protein